MIQVTIALPDAAKAYIDELLANGTYATVDELITALILAEKNTEKSKH